MQFRSPSVKFTPDGGVLVMAVGSEIVFWDLDKKKEIKRLSGFSSAVRAIDISRDGTKLVACDQETMKLFDLATDKPVALDKRVGKNLNGVTFSRDGTLLAFVGGDAETVTDPGELSIWSVAERKLLQRLAQPAGELFSVTFLLEDSMVLTGGVSNQQEGPPLGGTYLWNLKSGKCSLLPPQHKSNTWGVAVAAKKKILASAGSDGVIYWWDLVSRELVGSIKADVGGDGYSLTFSRDERYLLVGGSRGGVQMFSSR